MYYDSVNINFKGFDAEDALHFKIKELSLTLLSLAPSYSRVFIKLEKNEEKYICHCSITPRVDLFTVKKVSVDPSSAFEQAFCEMIIHLNKWRSNRKTKNNFLFYNNEKKSQNNLQTLTGGAA